VTLLTFLGADFLGVLRGKRASWLSRKLAEDSNAKQA